MGEYINKKEALEFLTQTADEAQKDADENGGESIIYAECLEDVIADIANFPNVDAVPVVRCKDCRFLRFSDCYGECSVGRLGIVRPDDFCSRGDWRGE